MKFVRIETTDLTSGFQLAINSEINSQLKIGAFAQRPITTSGTLILAVFKSIDRKNLNHEIRVNRFWVNNFCLTATAINALYDQQSLPDRFVLDQNYPNPFNGVTTIPFYAPTKAHVKCVIYNLLGEEVRILFDEEALPGKYRVIWDGKDEAGNGMASGIYMCKIFHSLGNEKIKIIYLE